MAFLWILIFTASYFASFLLTTAMISLAPILKFYDAPGGRKIHISPTPYGGGVSIFLSIYIFLGGAWLFLQYGDPSRWFPELRMYQSGFFSMDVIRKMSGILLGGVIIFITGFVDDIKNLKPRIKLLLTFFAALTVTTSGVQISVFTLLFSGTGLENSLWCDFANIAISIVWVIGITNAFNLIDNMDGLCSGVALIVSGVLLILSIGSGQILIASLIVLFMGAIGGFWVYNYSPARIFLGDSGSLLIGYFLSIATILPTFYQSHHSNANIVSVFLPVILLSIPIYDTLSVFVIRYRLGKSFFEGDRNHFSHRLENLGLSRQQAVLLIYLICLCVSLTALFLPRAGTFESILLFLQVLFIFFIILILENVGKKRKKTGSE